MTMFRTLLLALLVCGCVALALTVAHHAAHVMDAICLTEENADMIVAALARMDERGREV
jgi:hypothetical protein